MQIASSIAIGTAQAFATVKKLYAPSRRLSVGRIASFPDGMNSVPTTYSEPTALTGKFRRNVSFCNHGLRRERSTEFSTGSNHRLTPKAQSNDFNP